MSVIIEDTTVVIKRQYLDSEFAGGMEEFVARVKMAFSPHSISDDDPLFVRVGFATPEEAREAAAWLCRAAPEPRDEAADTTSGLLRIASSDGIRISLDLETGREIVSETDDPDQSPPMATPLYDALLRAIAERNWRSYSARAPEAMVDLLGDGAVYSCRYFAAEESRIVVCTVRCPLIIPEKLRDRAMQFITRANFGMFFGAFELNLDDGLLFFRTNCAVRDGALTTDMVAHLASAGAWAFDRYLPRLLQVLYGRRRVADAVKEADAA